VTPLYPVFFWAFLSLIPLAAVYFLKVRPRRKPTTAFFLWNRVFQEKRTSSLFRRLRDFWSLLLMALVFSAVVLALTDPQWTGDQRKDTLLLIDNSASMNARDGAGARLDRAKQIAADIVRAFNGVQRAAVATVGNELTYRSHLTDNPRQLLDAIESIEPSDYAFKADALLAADAEHSPGNEHRVILISDGCFDQAGLPQRMELFKVGDGGENIGIVAADMRYLPGSDQRLGLYVQVASTHKQTVQKDLLIGRNDEEEGERLMRLIPLEIEPGLNEPQVLTLDNAAPGRWFARLDVDDALERDNMANLAVEPPRPIRMAVQSGDRFFLENSVTAFSRGAGLLALTDETPQIVLARKSTPDAPCALIFQPEGQSPWWSNLGEEIDTAVPRLLVENHPALRFVDVLSIPMIGARRLEAPAGAQVWVASDEGVPLIYQAHAGGKTAIVVNMNPAAAEFYFSAWFPVLVHSAAAFLAGREETLVATYPPGSEVSVPGVQPDDLTKVAGPFGATAEIAGKRLPPLDRLGFYQLHNKSGDWLVGCSLLSSTETLLDNEAVKDTSKPISRGRGPAQLLTMLAIVVLAVESLLYFRRKVG